MIQPVDELQFKQLIVEWVPRGVVKPNPYNPNRMTEQDRLLLRQSILEDGWTQPLVVLADNMIVDGEQRWTVSGMTITAAEIDAALVTIRQREEQGGLVSDSIRGRLEQALHLVTELEQEGQTARLIDLTGGYVPVTHVDFSDIGHRMISTIRHNRARGAHQVDAMVEIMDDLQSMGMDADDFSLRLGMSEEEVNRLLGQVAQFAQVLDQEFSDAWEPKSISEITDPAVKAMIMSSGVRAQEQERLAKQHQIEREIADEIERQQPETYVERERIAAGIRKANQVSYKPAVSYRKLQFLLTVDEYELVTAVLGDRMAETLVEWAREKSLET